MEKLKLIQCGVGGFGKSWLSDVVTSSPDFELTAIVDVVDDNLAAAGDVAKLPAERCFRTLEAALEKVQADAVLTVTPPPVHIQHARLAFARGLHLMTEKPLAGTIEEAREMVKLAKEASRRLLVSQNYRYNAPYYHARQLLADGAVGEVGSGSIAFYIAPDFRKTFREAMEFPLLLDMSIHHFDLIRFITRKNIRKVTALSFNPPGSTFQHDAGLKMLLELEGGLAFSYDGDWTALGRTTSWSGNWRLQGSRGSLHIENDKLIVARSEMWAKNLQEEAVEPPALEFAARAATLHEFATVIRSGDSSELDGTSNLWSFGAVLAGMESSRTGRTVDVADVIGQT
jgi:predicted dehydrogenase